MRDGNRYEEVDNGSSFSTVKKSLSQLNYKQLQVNIPLQDFKLKRTNEELFKGNEEMLNVWQLDSVVDSTKRVLQRRLENLTSQSINNFYSRTETFLKAKRNIATVGVEAFYGSLTPDQFKQATTNALNIARSAAGNIEALELNIDGEKDSLIRFLMEWHKKIVICFACIVLFFVGAPLGAIIRKGGLGMPVIVSVEFFLAYYILTEMYMQLALEGALPPFIALWMPLIIFLPISIFLTVKAAKDSVIFDLSTYYRWIGKIFKAKEIV